MTYQVVVTREDDAWLADVPELEGAHTWARTLHGLDRAVREVVVLAEDLPDRVMADLDFDFEFRTGDGHIDGQAAELRRRRAKLEREFREVQEQTEKTAKRLVSDGYSIRDVAVLTGISMQRVSQLTKPGRARRAGTRKPGSKKVAAKTRALKSAPRPVRSDIDRAGSRGKERKLSGSPKLVSPPIATSTEAARGELEPTPRN